MDVIHVAGEVRLIADKMFPDPRLPKIVFAALIADVGNAVARQRPE
ncbi:MAG: hypothetical protein H6905_10305 [Hyphomicrobiales bacterium]|nr:hypothetical protein [Hyphomicrobiales bacterium]